MSNPYAVLGSDNIVIRVEIATPEWVSAWEAANPTSEYRYVPTSVDALDYAGIGFVWDATLNRFIPPMPTDEGRWVYDEATWAWVDLDAPVIESGEGETDGDTPVSE